MVDAPQIDELKELVKVSLQQTGVLSSIKAQLRAAVFKVVNDEQSLKASNPPPAMMDTSESALAADLVREYLEYNKLHSSLAVLIPEAGLDQDYPGRQPLALRLGVPDDPGCPLLVRLLSAHTSGAPHDSSTAPAPSSFKPKGGPPSAVPPTSEEDEAEQREEATPPPAQTESRAGRRTGELGGSPASPGDEPPAGMQKGGRGDAAEEAPKSSGLGTLAGMPSLGAGKGGGLGTLAGMPSLGRGGSGGSAGGFGLAADADEDEEEDDDDELTSTTRRMKIAEGVGAVGKGAEGSPGSAADQSLEERQNRMLEGAAKAELAMKNPQAMKNRAEDLAIELSDNDISEDDIVEEEIDAESDVDEEAPSPQWGPASKTEGASLSESCTEVSVSDRSVDGSLALEAFDHIEVVSAS